MRTPEEIRARIALLMADERLHYRVATIQINAPLALIQLSMEVEIHSLSWALGEPMPEIKRPKGRE